MLIIRRDRWLLINNIKLKTKIYFLFLGAHFTTICTITYLPYINFKDLLLMIIIKTNKK